jgi:glycosyltransferase involved in cell wall biosynthesis
MSKTYNVSVCMAVYNGEKYIRKQIESVLSELQLDDELLIYDDFSTDTTAKVMAEFELDKRVKFRKNATKLGILKNFERVLQEAQGDYIFLCDQDDVWLSGKVQACVDALKKHLLVVTDCVVVNQDLEVISPSFFELRHSGAGVLKNIWKNSYLGCCMAFRRELLNYSLPIPENMPMHDMWLGLVAEVNGSVLFIDEKLSLYRRHESAASPTAGVSNFGVFKQIKVRLILIWCLACRMLKTKFGGFGKKVTLL